jgi:hypothetical protein
MTRKERQTYFPKHNNCLHSDHPIILAAGQFPISVGFGPLVLFDSFLVYMWCFTSSSGFALHLLHAETWNHLVRTPTGFDITSVP